jgi:hypothetical protein
MHRTAMRFALGLTLAFAFTGCQSHKAKVAALQKQYDQLGAQYRKDCFSEVTQISPKPSRKCIAEKRTLDATWNRLQVERAKK